MNHIARLLGVQPLAPQLLCRIRDDAYPTRQIDAVEDAREYFYEYFLRVPSSTIPDARIVVSRTDNGVCVKYDFRHDQALLNKTQFEWWIEEVELPPGVNAHPVVQHR